VAAEGEPATRGVKKDFDRRGFGASRGMTTLYPLSSRSSSSLSSLSPLACEYRTLKTAIEAHRAKIDAAWEVAEEAKEFAGLPKQHGLYQFDFKKDSWRYPSMHLALQQLEVLKDDDGFYWAESRLRDLELLLGLGGNRQTLIPFDTLVPDAHPSVKGFLAGR